MSAEQSKKIISLEELQAHSGKDDLYLLIHNKVYAVTKFLDEHPGGDEVILAEAGKDATEAFEDVGHSDEAREVLAGLYVGEFDAANAKDFKTSSIGSNGDNTSSTKNGSGSSVTYLIPAALIGAFLAWRFYFAP
ncbi:hypothetical protein FRC03_012763 [Tulasnella sp. 419]|nr:hypothetical protein FRC02_003161 [Tulasnella sp. 418]KAG8965927.1 hypothetical protein FRC03_012763 [Tulasnella sp. 419]